MDLARKVAVNTANLTVGRIALAASGLIGTAATTRYLGLEPFGSLTIALLLVSMFATFGDAGIYQVVAREIARRPHEEGKLLGNALGVGMVAAVATTGLTLLVSTVAYPDADRELLRQAVAIIAVQLLFSGLNGTAFAYLTVRQRLAPVAYAAVLSSLVFLVVLALAIELDWGFTGVAAAYAAGGVANAVPAAWVLRRRRVRPAADLTVWRDVVRWAAPQGLIIVLGVMYFRLDSFLLSFLADKEQVALYGLAYKVIEVLTFLPGYFVATLFPEFARAERGSEALAGMTQASFTLLQLMAVAISIVFIGFASETVRVVGGPEFAEAAVVLVILTGALVLLFVNTLLFQVLVALRQQRRLVWMVLTVLVVNVALNFLLIPPFGARGSALAVFLCEILAFAVAAGLYRSAAGRLPRPFRVPQVLLATAAGATGVLAAKAAGAATDAPDIVVVGIGAPVALALYAAALVVLRSVPGEITEFSAALRGRLPRRSALR